MRIELFIEPKMLAAIGSLPVSPFGICTGIKAAECSICSRDSVPSTRGHRPPFCGAKGTAEVGEIPTSSLCVVNWNRQSPRPSAG